MDEVRTEAEAAEAFRVPLIAGGGGENIGRERKKCIELHSATATVGPRTDQSSFALVEALLPSFFLRIISIRKRSVTESKRKKSCLSISIAVLVE